MKPQFAHRVKKPFKYTPSESTDVARTIREARKALEEEAKAAEATNVQPLRKRERQAA